MMRSVARINPDALPLGSTLHWYRIESVLGQGGFGLTYLATDTNLDHQVALKEYLPIEFAARLPDGSVLARSEELEERFAWGLERFVSEAKVLARFDHPNIVRVHSVFQHNNTAYMVMRYEEGENLESILRGGRELGEQELLDLLLPILDGLEAIHAEGFIHRDIKPDNLYVRRDGSPVLIDFGSARHAAGASRMLTILVAPGYAPFEQYYESSTHQGPWTDIYGLGATLYRAVAGRPPADAIARSRGVLGSTRDILEPAVEVGRGRYSARFLEAIDHALRFAEGERPQSIAEWREDFGVAAGAGGTVSAEAPTVTAEVITAPRGPTQPVPPQRPAAADSGAGAGTGRAAAYALVAIVAAGAGYLVAHRATPTGQDAAPRVAAATADAETRAERERLAAREQALTEREQALASARDALQAERSALDAERAGLSADRDAQEARQGKLDEEARALAGRADAVAQSQARAADASRRLERLETALAEREAQQTREAQRLREEREALARLGAGAQELQALREQVAVLEARLRDRATARAAPAKRDSAPEPTAPAPPAAEPPARPSLDGARAALATGDFAEARRQLEILAQAGHPEADFHLGVMHLEGQGAPVDAAAGVAALQRAAAAGLGQAQLRLGEAYAGGVNGAEDLAAAVRWYRDAATLGLAEAQWRLGEMYARGRGVTQDDFLAYTWLAAAAEQGKTAAHALLDEVGQRLQPMEVEQARRLSRQYVGKAE